MASRSVREAVAVFPDAAALQAAVDDLLVAGFDRAHLSLMANGRRVAEALGRPYAGVREIEDDPEVPRIAWFGRDSRTEGIGAAASGLAYIGACAAGGAVAAADGALVLAGGIAAIAGGGCFALGAVAARSIDGRWRRNLAEQVERGGIVLWVVAISPAREADACAILRRNGGADVHLHDLPLREAGRDGGVSREFTWIGKPILQNLLGRAARQTAPRPSA